jgi:hypothetical protein
MGAEYWQHQTPYEPDAEEALVHLQVEVFRQSGFDLAKLMAEGISNMSDAIHACEQDDPYGLVEHYRDCLRRLRRVAALGVPDDPVIEISRLREIEAISSSTAPGILALEGISSEWEDRMARLLSAEQMNAVFGTSTPSTRDVDEAHDRLTDLVDRGLAVCFPVYEGEQPVLWHFAGYTAD